MSNTIQKELNSEQQSAFDFLKYTNKNIFLTGKAGTGKTTFLHMLKRCLPKRMIVVAPTGVAAINAGGVTIHSFFQMPFGPQIPLEQVNDHESGKGFSSGYLKLSREKINIIRSLDLIIIDEISMVRADLLDGIDQVVRRFRKKDTPFGGIQLLMIGDLLQLSPVAKDDEWDILKQYYETPYFFSSLALKKTGYVSFELRHIYRQTEQSFIEILNKIRENRIDQATLDVLNQRYIPGFIQNEKDGYITLTTHNYQAKNINDKRLSLLPGKESTFTAEITDDFPEYMYPAEFLLNLKPGAQVMFIKNDISPEKRFYNGKIGVVAAIHNDTVTVKCKEDESSIGVERVEWQNMRYSIDPETKSLVETVIGEFRQFPLKLAWAVTIHKSQGLTFDKLVIDSNAAFAHGQVYVALSRCRTLDGIVLQAPVSIRSIKTDERVIDFTRKIQENPPEQKLLEHSKREYEKSLCMELFDFDSIHKNLNYLIKLLNENSQIIQMEMIQAFGTFREGFRSEIVAVSEKFSLRIAQLCQTDCSIEENDSLQDYVQRASPYFVNKLQNETLSWLESNALETDNKKVNKTLQKAMQATIDSIQQKIICLQGCGSKFTVAGYLDNRAKAAVTTSEKKINSTDSNVENQVVMCKNQDLFTLLRSWRNEKAAELDVPVYMILPQKTMMLLADKLPADEGHLKKIHGIGKQKLKSFGSELLEIIVKYADCKGLDKNNFEMLSDDVGNGAPKIDKENETKQLSFTLFKGGKSLEEIASQRNLALSTIEGHIAYYAGIGEVDIHSIIPHPTITLICQTFERLGREKLSPVKSELGDAVTYGQLKLVQKYLDFTQSQCPAQPIN